MRYELPPAIAERIAACARPTLVYDRARIASTFATIAAAARAHAITTLFAMKSFPHDDVLAIAAASFDGFDVASGAEARRASGAHVVSIADPSGLTFDATADRLIVSCETVPQVTAAPKRAEIAIRLSTSAGARDPAIGAILDGSGHRRSRFGIDLVRRREQVAALVAAADGRPVGIHLHHGAVTATSPARFVATIEDALASVDLAPAFVNAGGAWHGIIDVAQAFAALRARFPSIEILAEPGRVLARDAGFACGRVTATRALDDRALVVLDLSRICHLRWSPAELVARPPAAGGEPIIIVGPTCFEEDVIAEHVVEPGAFFVGARAIVRDVTGYALAWNTGFAGVPPADVIVA